LLRKFDAAEVLVRSAAPPGQPSASGSCPLRHTTRTAFRCGFLSAPLAHSPAAGSCPLRHTARTTSRCGFLSAPLAQPPAAGSCPLHHTARTASSCGFLSALPQRQDSLQLRVLVRSGHRQDSLQLWVLVSSATPPGQPPAAGSCPLCRTARTASS
jgi:hypothetical protein